MFEAKTLMPKSVSGSYSLESGDSGRPGLTLILSIGLTPGASSKRFINTRRSFGTNFNRGNQAAKLTQNGDFFQEQQDAESYRLSDENHHAR